MWIVFMRDSAVTKGLGLVLGEVMFNDRLIEVFFWER